MRNYNKSQSGIISFILSLVTAFVLLFIAIWTIKTIVDAAIYAYMRFAVFVVPSMPLKKHDKYDYLAFDFSKDKDFGSYGFISKVSDQPFILTGGTLFSHLSISYKITNTEDDKIKFISFEEGRSSTYGDNKCKEEIKNKTQLLENEINSLSKNSLKIPEFCADLINKFEIISAQRCFYINENKINLKNIKDIKCSSGVTFGSPSSNTCLVGKDLKGSCQKSEHIMTAKIDFGPNIETYTKITYRRNAELESLIFPKSNNIPSDGSQVDIALNSKQNGITQCNSSGNVLDFYTCSNPKTRELYDKVNSAFFEARHDV